MRDYRKITAKREVEQDTHEVKVLKAKLKKNLKRYS